ncbi:DUF928 domain-containing protein [Phormidium sp. FACHB-592]|uniref:DUF928 domain-containing protein n=1 Tax=Stenomitos frigidus AS-A4 TaxID=2933935 RepID=A0ABV0KU21_9CYAN|nr:DUF928 domain-containing protein [Phormidium sp. FACHB-592]MBD2077160.1 DUF928 domain-containing protein [Phormidium sp. FACHB-592]
MMKWTQYSIALVLELTIVNTIVAIAPSAAIERHGSEQSLFSNVKKTQLAQSNPPPPPSNPGSSSAGGRRDPANCPQDTGAAPNPLLTALSPTAKAGLTLAERPTFLVYVPKTSAKNAEFSLQNRMRQGIYHTKIALTTTPNLISITLPAQAMPLEVGKPYTWSFAIICNADDRLEDRFVRGMVQRIELDATRLRQIQQASPREQATLYQKADIWYDAIAVLYQLKRSQRNDPGITTAWRELLQAAGVDTIIDSNPENANTR